MQLQGSLSSGLPEYPSSSEPGSGGTTRAAGSSLGLNLPKLPLASDLSPAESWERGSGNRAAAPPSLSPLPFLSPFLPLSLSSSPFSVFKSHYMGFCSFGTSSFFPLCPGTSGAVTGMLRTWSVDSRDCTNERIQALLVSGGWIR